ncbi:MAG: hypothetical protein H6812_10890 [Phycisphaeraceae bacterium]|nr:hypothetical protein [Phycisphaerales bacterium]MCB9843749.1 hypothetical protein [Phycisphaeraceae bacterium]
MSTTIDHAKSIADFFKRLPSIEVPEDVEPLEATNELVFSFLLWESTTQRARPAMQRVASTFVDLNELRASRIEDIVEVLGKTYPRGEERAMRLKASLHEIFSKEHEVSLAKASSLGKRDARKYLDNLPGMVPFVAGRVVLLSMGGHAFPLEDRSLAMLIEHGVLEPDMDLPKAVGILERHIMADQALKQYLSFQAWVEMGGEAPKKPARSAARGTKTATRSRPTKSAKSK